MRVAISSSTGLKVLVLLITVVGFVLVYEAEVFDSRHALWQSMAGGGPPGPGTQMPFTATAYCKGTTTASGVAPRSGVAAADPALLPVGSVLNVGTGEERYNGVYTVMDTGPKVQGRILDLYIWSCHEALRFGRRDVQVTVLRLGWDPRASSPGLVDRLFRRREATRRVPAPVPPPPSDVEATAEGLPATAQPEAPGSDTPEPAVDAAAAADATAQQ